MSWGNKTDRSTDDLFPMIRHCRAGRGYIHVLGYGMLLYVMRQAGR